MDLLRNVQMGELLTSLSPHRAFDDITEKVAGAGQGAQGQLWETPHPERDLEPPKARRKPVATPPPPKARAEHPRVSEARAEASRAAAERIRAKAARPACACERPWPGEDGRCERCCGFEVERIARDLACRDLDAPLERKDPDA